MKNKIFTYLSVSKIFTILILMCLIILPKTMIAQVVTVSTANPANWGAADFAGLNVNPVGIPGAFPIVPIAQCGGGSRMTIPDNNGGTCGTGHPRTRFFSTTVNLNGCYNGTCTVAADDYLRIFVNGIQVTPSTTTLAGCSGFTINSLNANNAALAINSNVLLQGNNTIVIEVGNCTGPSWVSGTFTFNPLPPLPAGNQLNYTFNGPGSTTSYSVNFWGVNPKSMKILGYSGIWAGNWLVETGPTTNGPWSFFQSRVESTSSMNSPWVSNTLSIGQWVQVTYTITTICGNTATYTVKWCVGCRPEGPIIVDSPVQYLSRNAKIENDLLVSEEGMIEQEELLNTSYNWDADTSSIGSNDIQVLNANYDRISESIVISFDNDTFIDSEIDLKLFDVQGKLIWYNNLPNSKNAIFEIANLAPGLYILHAKNKETLLPPRKIFALN
jgi:hypothetical protein